ncbi:MAG: MBL fold metallo-hydrolase [Oscillospiraceae bacterium]|nr:MBL fold metallo-hydrolase [Oscillospiraceae bacterium]
MLHIQGLPLGDYQTNCYILWGENASSCVVIDPGYDAQRILQQIAQLGLSVEAIFLTHGHFDHVGAVEEIVQKTGCALWMHQADWAIEPGYGIAQLFPLANCDFCPVNFYDHHQQIFAARLTFRIWQTPGHTWGSVCIGCEDVLFTGDTLFAGSIGRTDFPHSHHPTMLDSLNFLKSQDKDYTLYPGHGEASSLSYEKKYNPFLTL